MKYTMRMMMVLAIAWLISTVPTLADPSTSAGQPDALLIVYPTGNGRDAVGITYPSVVPQAQVVRDISSIQTQTGWTIKNIKITYAFPPIKGSKDKMTSAVFVALNAVPPADHYLTLEPIITAMRNYPHLALTYFLDQKFQFQGLRAYDDKFVNINLDQQGSTYTYHVLIRSTRFQKLNLPLYQVNASQVQSVEALKPKPHHSVRAWQIVLLGLVAAGAGIVVYIIIARHN